MDRVAVVEKLASFGKAIDTTFDQGARASGHLTEGQVDEGYCRGVALDWIRRTAQGGMLSYHETKDRHDRSRTVRMATAYLNMGRFEDHRNAIIAAGVERVQALAAGHEKLAILYNSNKDNHTATIGPDDIVFLSNHFAFDPPLLAEVATSLLFDCLQRLATKSHEELAVVTEMRQTTHLVATWQQFAERLDQHFQEARIAEGRHGPRRPFSGLATGESTERKPYPNFASSTSTVLSTLKAPWNAVLIGYGLKVRQDCTCAGGTGATASDSGHAVAVLLKGDPPHPYLLFEPNYGTYSYTRESLERALAFLFDPVEHGPYNSRDDFLCKNKIRHRDGQTLTHTGGMRYTVFFPKNPPLEESPPVARAAAMAVPAVRPPVAMPSMSPPLARAAAAAASPMTSPVQHRSPPMAVTRPPAAAAPRTTATPPPQPPAQHGGAGSVAAAKKFWQTLDGK